MLELTFFILVITALMITSIVVTYNFITAPVLGNSMRDLKSAPLVSILIPARNEQNNIENCLQSILNQYYNNYEVLVLDDNSKDLTSEIVEQFADKNKKVTLISGESLPNKWLGKSWACHQLSKKAKGEILLFMDADVMLGENCINNLLNSMQIRNVSMLSVFPTQLMKTFGEWLTVPLVNWMLFTFLPLSKVFSSSKKKFVAANGQLIAFDKKVYDLIGGHESVKSEIAEDMQFARLLKRRKHKILTVLGGKAVFSRMYRNFEDGFNGLSQNFFSIFNLDVFAFSVLLILFSVVWLLPILFSFANFLFIFPVLLILYQRIVISMLSGQNRLGVLLHPFQIIVLMMIGINSMYLSKTGKLNWKGRSIN